MLVTRTPDGSLQTTAFLKPMLTGKYCTYLFPSTIHFNKNLAFSNSFLPSWELNKKENELKKDEIRTINTTLITNGFPTSQTTACSLWKRIQQTIILTVVPTCKISLESIKRIFQQVGVGVAMKPVYVLSNIFCKPKDKVLEKEKSGLLYQIFCRDCDAVFYRLNRSKLRN